MAIGVGGSVDSNASHIGLFDIILCTWSAPAASKCLI